MPESENDISFYALTSVPGRKMHHWIKLLASEVKYATVYSMKFSREKTFTGSNTVTKFAKIFPS